MRLCSYVVKNDYGFAPNPFFDYCTLAACTPNHQGTRLVSGDWIMGHATAYEGQRLIYAMEVAEVLDLDHYHRDPRFERKKPRFDGTWREACGDNIYYRDRDGNWIQVKTLFHDTPEDRDKDTRYAVVYISKHFYYFGGRAQEIPESLSDLIWTGRGCKCSHPTERAEAFVEWLETNFERGIHSRPRDLEKWTNTVRYPVPRGCALSHNVVGAELQPHKC